MQDLTGLGATRMIVGLSQLVPFNTPAYCYGVVVKNITPGSAGTLELCQAALTGTSSAANVGWSQGYPLAINESVAAAGPVRFYMAAMGATATVAILMGTTTGASII